MLLPALPMYRGGWRLLRIEPTEGLYWPGDSKPAGYGEIGLETVRFLATGKSRFGDWTGRAPCRPRGFDEAVEFAKAHLSHFLPDPEGARKLRGWLVARFFTVAMAGAGEASPYFGGDRFYRPVSADMLPPGLALDESFVERCIEKAASSRPHYDALRESAAVLLRAGRLDGALADWAADVLVEPDSRRPSGRRGPQPWTNKLRDKAIIATIERLEAEGMTVTRNEVSAPKSACDAVAKALPRMSYDGVLKIWGNRRRL